MNGSIQKKKDSRSDFQGLLFVFKCSVVIIWSHLFNRKDSHTTKTDLHCYGIFNTGNSESSLCSSMVCTLQFNTWGYSLLKLLYNVECISGHKVTTVTKTNAWPTILEKKVGTVCPIWFKEAPPFPPMQCWSVSCCQRPRQVAQHWLMGVGKDMTNGELGGFFKTMHCPKCPYNREHWDNCNKVDQVSQLFFSRIVAVTCRNHHPQ